MPQINKIITADAKKQKEEAERKKRLGRVQVEKLPTKAFSHTSVEDIVSRMKQRYDARGYGKQQGKGAELKKKIAGTKAISLDQREPKELVLAKGSFPRLVGKVYSHFSFMNAVTLRVSDYGLAKHIPYQLDKANMNYSSKQYVSMAIIAALFVGVFTACLSLVLAHTLFSPMFTELATTLSAAKGPLIPSVIIEDFDSVLVATALNYFLAFAFTFLITFAFFVITLLVAFQWPSNIAAKRGKAIDKELPFALRHMSTEVKAGIGIYKTMTSIVEADYGELSVEFKRTLSDIDKGTSTKEALVSMSERSPSENLARAIMHISRTMRTGGNLSEIIETIASEVAFELRMKMRDFVERLNLIGLFYMMAGIVFPVFVAVLAGIFNSIPTIGLAGVLGTEMLFLLYFILIPMVLSLILYIIKVMQPM